MADFPNIPIEVSAKNLELVASRPLIVYPTAPKGTDVGKEGQFWYAETTNELFIYTSNKKWENINSVDLSEYVKNTFTIAGLPLTEDITDKELYVALGVSPTIQSDEPPHNTTGRAGQIYIQEFEDGSTKLYIQARSGGGQRWLDITDGITGNVKKTLQIAGISLSGDISKEDLISALGTPKVVVKDVDPTSNNGDENTFWINKTKNTLYYCYSRSLSGYNWIKISGGASDSLGVTNLLPKAVSSDGVTVYNKVGYKADTRWSSSGNVESTVTGIYLTGYIPCQKGDTIYLKNVVMPNVNGNSCLVHFFNEDLSVAVQNSNNVYIENTCGGIWGEDGNLIQFTIPSSAPDCTHIRIQCGGLDNTSIITVNEEIPEDTTDTRIDELEQDVKEINDKITTINENLSTLDADPIPEYWKSHLEEKTDTIRQALENVGDKKSAFLWYTDVHWNYGAQVSPILLKYLFEHTPINKTNFGGDIVNNEGDVSTESGRETMSYLWDWRTAIRNLPNHHSVVGNHDDGNATNNLFNDDYIYAYLLSPEENQFVVKGEGFYYYIDDKPENTRYLYLDTGYKGVDDKQLEFIKNALKTTPNGYHIVVIAHIWYEPDYDQYEVRPIPIVGLSTDAIKVVTELDKYNSRQYEYSNCGGWVEFCIGGHVHIDYDGTTETGIPIILTETDSFHNRSGLNSAQGTINEASLSAIIADYENHKINVIRVGRGSDRSVEYNGLNMLDIDPKDEIATTGYVNNIVDSVNSALDEIHAYAQSIISGGDEV